MRINNRTKIPAEIGFSRDFCFIFLSPNISWSSISHFPNSFPTFSSMKMVCCRRDKFLSAGPISSYTKKQIKDKMFDILSILALYLSLLVSRLLLLSSQCSPKVFSPALIDKSSMFCFGGSGHVACGVKTQGGSYALLKSKITISPKVGFLT